MVRQQKNEELMAAGVTLIDPATTYIDTDVEVGPDTVIHPCVFLEGGPTIGSACEIHAGAASSTRGSAIACVIRNHTVITDSTVAAGASVGPFAHLRPGAQVGENAHVGNFVELKKTTMGKGARPTTSAYLGDATIGANVNVGAGTITCNYDGETKHQTVIEDGVVRRQQRDTGRAGHARPTEPTSPRARASPTTCPGRARQSAAAGRRTKRGGSRNGSEAKAGKPGLADMCGIIGYIGPKPVVPFSSRACGGSSIAATTRRAWRSSTARHRRPAQRRAS